MRQLFIITLLTLLSACGSMPKHADIRSDDRPTIYIDKSGIGSEIHIDGQYLGLVNKDRQTFATTPGKHDIKIISPSGTITKKTIFVQGNTRREITPNQ
ncbi:hypothetical protein [Paremcibacter congregatus]|uniref:PEGA domain-containing protein n=1 Tax=Paremcibacter congregatus TaxID=2043170 RepID=A0A2G4YLV3_9PROT|nr:hypothetical protein [Paremcibacter congregatus]PHZ83303.1 hypothetical protein CRD36_17200 [Paremcibacter congregatus]QDE28223.1 hypothetical protein FIV45_13585 [Paremcibacter congregatus]